MKPKEVVSSYRGYSTGSIMKQKRHNFMKQVQATHRPTGQEFDVKPILCVIEDILHQDTPAIDGVIKGNHEHIITLEAVSLEAKTTHPGFDGILEALAYIIHRISLEFSCKYLDGGDFHAITMAIFNMLQKYSWYEKVVISLAAFAVNYGEFRVYALLWATNPLVKSVAVLKQFPYMIEMKSQSIKNLIKVMLDLTKCIVQFKELPSKYISDKRPPMSDAMDDILEAAYWLIRSMLVCMSQMTRHQGMVYKECSEQYSLLASDLASQLAGFFNNLKTGLALCYQRIALSPGSATFLNNIKILEALIYSKDDLPPLMDGSTKTRVNIEVLGRKTVLLLISGLDLSDSELAILLHCYNESRARPEIHYELMWIPIVDNVNEVNEDKFVQLQSVMPWQTIHHPSLLEPVGVNYIKEVWHFEGKMILVALDPEGKVVCPNAHHMMWIWGNAAHPFTTLKEEALWEKEIWRLELLVDSIKTAQPTLDWISQGRFVCLYGGEKIGWIREFTQTAKDVAKTAGITLEMLYVGTSSTIIEKITEEKLSHCWNDPASTWLFWARLGSMRCSKIQLGKTEDNDSIMEEVSTVLGFAASDQGWAIISKGSTEMAKETGKTVMESLTQFSTWKQDAHQKGFVPALIDHLHKLNTAPDPNHDSCHIRPYDRGNIRERLCTHCGRSMDKHVLCRCCSH